MPPNCRCPQAELPSENFLLHMAGQGEAIVMAGLASGRTTISASHSPARARPGRSPARRFTTPRRARSAWPSSTAPASGIERDIAAAEADQVLRLDWKAPYPAHWRVDWQRDDKLIDSWEMLTQKPDGELRQARLVRPAGGRSATSDWSKTGRRRWTTVLGNFLYPCWIDKDGQGYLQPLSRKARFQGPALIYPINRLASTPLDEFTVVDIMRATLGVGPCEYVLDVEGQKKTFQGRPTCASRTILDNIYGRNQQKAKRAEVEKTLDEVIAFVRHIRGRIEDYTAFGHEMIAWLEQQKQTQPQLAESLADMQATCRQIDEYTARRKDKLKTPEYATQLVDDFRTNLVDYEGDDALKKCKRITAALVDIGGNQDELVGECRMTVKRLRQQAALLMAADPQAGAGRPRSPPPHPADAPQPDQL